MTQSDKNILKTIEDFLNKNQKEEIIEVKFFEDSIKNPTIAQYEELPQEIKNKVDDLASSILDPSGGKAIVLGYPVVGKTFIIEQFVMNIDRYLEITNQENFYFITLNSRGYEKILGSGETLNDFVEQICDGLKCEKEDLCLITENISIAADFNINVKGIKVILEMNVATFQNLIVTEKYGQSKTWSSWEIIDANEVYPTKNSLVEMLSLIVIPTLPKNELFKFEKKHLLIFINHALKVFPDLMGEEELKNKIIAPPGFWAGLLRRLAGIMAFSSNPELYHQGRKIFERAVKMLIEERSGDFQARIEDFNSEEQDFSDEDEEDSILKEIFNSLSGGKIETEEETEKLDFNFKDMSTLSRRLKKEIIGQDDAVDSLVKTLTVPAAGLHQDNKPYGSFLFNGPTGVGKTKLAQTLSKELMNHPMNLIRLDMSEYSQEHEAAKLIGSPPGYVGSGEGGILTNSVIKNPHSLILIDEVEKAHPKIINSFLQLLDAGRMTDGKGIEVDFSKTVFIMTSNLGAAELTKKTLGFSSISDEEQYKNRKEQSVNIIDRSLKTFFPLEFLNRIDNKIIFNELPIDAAKQIVLKELNLLSKRLDKKKFSIDTFDDEILNWVLTNSDVSQYGAREIQRFIINNVSPLLSKEILKKRTSKKATLKLFMNKNKILDIKSN